MKPLIEPSLPTFYGHIQAETQMVVWGVKFLDPSGKLARLKQCPSKADWHKHHTEFSVELE